MFRGRAFQDRETCLHSLETYKGISVLTIAFTSGSELSCLHSGPAGLKVGTLLTRNLGTDSVKDAPLLPSTNPPANFVNPTANSIQNHTPTRNLCLFIQPDHPNSPLFIS